MAEPISNIAGDRLLTAIHRDRPDMRHGQFGAGAYAAIKRLERDLGEKFVAMVNARYELETPNGED